MNISPCIENDGINRNYLKSTDKTNQKWTDFKSKLRTNRVTTVYAARAIIIQEYLEDNRGLYNQGIKFGDESSMTSLDLYALNNKSINSGFPQNISALNISIIDFESLNQNVRVSDIAQDIYGSIEAKPKDRHLHREAFDEYVNTIVGRTTQKPLPKEKASLRRSLSLLFCSEDSPSKTTMSKEIPTKMQGNNILKRSRSLLFNYSDDELIATTEHHDKNDYYMRQDRKETEGKIALGTHECESSSMNNCLCDDFSSSITNVAQNDRIHKSSSAPRLPLLKKPNISTNAFLQEMRIGSTNHKQGRASFEGSWPALLDTFGEQNYHASALELRGGSTCNDLSQAAQSLKNCLGIIKEKQLMKKVKPAKKEKLLVDFPTLSRRRMVTPE